MYDDRDDPLFCDQKPLISGVGTLISSVGTENACSEQEFRAPRELRRVTPSYAELRRVSTELRRVTPRPEFRPFTKDRLETVELCRVSTESRPSLDR
eukprot:6982215-Alexandrium_andersonii.AAC.1